MNEEILAQAINEMAEAIAKLNVELALTKAQLASKDQTISNLQQENLELKNTENKE